MCSFSLTQATVDLVQQSDEEHAQPSLGRQPTGCDVVREKFNKERSTNFLTKPVYRNEGRTVHLSLKMCQMQEALAFNDKEEEHYRNHK